ncbi:MAG: glutamine amidotransferase [Thermoguttaceae bacterium]
MQPVLYLGDGDCSRAAAYLSGVLAYFGIPFDRLDSDQVPSENFLDKEYSSFILSDFPRNQFRSGQLERLVQKVNDGAGLLMIGGWESFHGLNGEYNQSPLVDVLPVEMLDRDDRRNYAQPLYLKSSKSHEITKGLPWKSPPTVGGFNVFRAKSGSETVLNGLRIDVRLTEYAQNDVEDCRFDGKCELDGHPLLSRATLELKSSETLIFSEVEEIPMLVLGSFGQGRTAAFASDVAPHWVGGFVDWGTERVIQPVGDGFVDVGKSYAQFFSNLVRWTAKEL